MTQAMLGMHTALAILYPLFALIAGYNAGALAYRTEVDAMRRTAARNMKLLATVGILAASEAFYMIYAGTYGWNIVRNQAMLFIPLIVLPLIAVAIFTMPRLIHLSGLQATVPFQTLSRTKRRAAASGWLVVPVQALAVGSLLYSYKLLYPMSENYYYELLAILVVLIVVTSILAIRQTLKRRFIHRDSGRSAIHRLKRGVIYVLAITLLPFSLTYSVIEAKNERIGTELPTIRLSAGIKPFHANDPQTTEQRTGFFATLSRFTLK